MKKKEFLALAILFILFEICIGLRILNEAPPTLERSKINEIQQLVQYNWTSLQNITSESYDKYEFSVIDMEEQLLFQEGKGVVTINDAIQHQDLILDVMLDGNKVGSILFYTHHMEFLQQSKQQLLFLFSCGVIGFLIILILYMHYLDKQVFRPFQNLRCFAARVANGNFDIPLPMDCNQAFGAFSESFDLMRSELKEAYEREQEATRSKKELVAKLSHDIKTPVASIKAVTEVMLLKTKDDSQKEQLHTIDVKADQIDLLITDLFHATLEELEQLQVLPVETDSLHVQKLLANADYLHKAKIPKLPECLVIADLQRLQQVFDNVFNNSYKYANTSIQVRGFLEQDVLHIIIQDAGKMISEQELPFLCEKFYRGTNAEGKSGSGLGLYISEYLMRHMDGDLYCEIQSEFMVHILLKLL